MDCKIGWRDWKELAERHITLNVNKVTLGDQLQTWILEIAYPRWLGWI